MVCAPVPKGLEDGAQAVATRGEGVADAWGPGGVAVAVDDSGLGEVGQTVGQHLVREGGQGRAQLGVGVGAAQEFADDQCRPPAVQGCQRDLYRALGGGGGDVGAGVVGEACGVANRWVSHGVAS